MNDMEKLQRLLPELQFLASQLPAVEELISRAPAEVRDRLEAHSKLSERKPRPAPEQYQVIDHIWVKAQAASQEDADDYWRVSVKRVTDKVGGTEVGDAFDVLLLGKAVIESGKVLPAVLSYFPSTGDHPDRWIGLAPEVGTADVPAVILPANFEQEAVAEDTWDRDSPPAEKDGVQVRVQMRTAYNDAGDETLYAFYRTFIYDSQGNLVTISAETRVSVDVAEACP